MNAIKRHPLFTAWLVLCAALLVGELNWAHRLRQHVRHERARLAQKAREKTHLLEITRSPPVDFPVRTAFPFKAALTAVAVDVIPPRPLDAFIEIAATRETLRRLAAEHGIVVRADESFGFASYAREGPQEEQIAAVHRQLGLVRSLLGKLFAVRPTRLAAVQRESLDAGRADRPPGSASDFFRLDPRMDFRVAGLIEGGAVRLEFTGPTRVLRSFLNLLAEAPEPLLVRSVEAEPLQTGLMFSVVVEQITSVGSFSLLEMTAGDAGTVALWLAPETSAVADQPGDLFDAPGAGRSAPDITTNIAPADRVELLAVKREPYRLQLVGYFGSIDHSTGAFISPGSPETLLARVGHCFESLGLTVRSLRVEKRTGPAGDEMIPVATIWDERNQETVTLDGRERLLTDVPLAVLRLAPLPAKLREFRRGATFREGASECSVEQIQLDPAEVVIVRRPPGPSAPERLVLRPAAAQPAPASAGQVVTRTN